MMNRLDKDGKV